MPEVRHIPKAVWVILVKAEIQNDQIWAKFELNWSRVMKIIKEKKIT